MRKFADKIGAVSLSLAIFTVCFTSNVNAQEITNNSSALEEINAPVTPLSAEFENADNDKLLEFLPEIEAMSDSVDTVEDLVDSIKKSVSKIPEFIDDTVIEISNVQIFRNSNDCDNGIEVTQGDLEDQMIVKVFYDEGKSWVQYTINPSVPEEHNMSISPYSTSYSNFTLPLDDMNLTSNIVCLFNCSNISGCSKCLASGYGTWRNRQHNGIDISWSGIDGTCIRAVRSGTVTKGYSENGWGNWIKIDHTSTLSTLYAHMKSASTVSGSVLQGNIIGQVGSTGYSTGPHLHFEVYLNNERVDPLGDPNYLSGASAHIPDPTLAKTFKIVDGPLTIRSSASASSTSYGTLANGTLIAIKDIEIGGNFVFGKISSGTHSGRWIAVASITGDIYAADLTSVWTVTDGPLNVRASASTSSTSYGTISNGTIFKITDTELYGNYIMGKITNVSTANGSTCGSSTANGKWVALGCSSSKYCSTYNY